MKQMLFVTTPFVLAVPPVLGWLIIGRWLDEKFNSQPFLMYGFIILEFIIRFGNGA